MKWRKNKDGTYGFRVSLHEIRMIHRALDEMDHITFHRNEGFFEAVGGLEVGDPLRDKLWEEYEDAIKYRMEWSDMRREFDTLKLVEEIEGRTLKPEVNP